LSRQRGCGIESLQLRGDLVGILAVVFVAEGIVLNLNFFEPRLILVAERNRLGIDPPHGGGHRVIEFRFDHDSFPTLGLKRGHLRRTLVAHKAIEQRGIGEEAAVLLVEQVTDDGAARSLIGFCADEHRAAVVGGYLPLRQCSQDCITAAAKRR
jgi:hypothetical protein